MLSPVARKLFDQIPAGYQKVLAGRLNEARFTELAEFIAQERKTEKVFPAESKIFAAMELTPFEQVRVVILGQDPYHDDGQAHGLAFSVPDEVRKLPPSLRNIFKELESDLGTHVGASGNLESWAKQGVLLLNTVLTVRAHEAGSHQKRGWEEFTDAVIKALSERSTPMVFVLWGACAQGKKKLIDQARHRVFESAHPSPLSAYRGFLGSRLFSSSNIALEDLGQPPVSWSLPKQVNGEELPLFAKED